MIIEFVQGVIEKPIQKSTLMYQKNMGKLSSVTEFQNSKVLLHVVSLGTHQQWKYAAREWPKDNKT